MINKTDRNREYPKLKSKNYRLIDIVGSTKCFELLRVLLFRSDEQMYQSEIVKRSGLSPNTAIPLLKELASYGIIYESFMAGTIFYRIKEDNPVIKQLKILINVTNIYESAKELAEDTEIYLFGSAARGEDTEKSDIDLLVLTNINSNLRESLKNKLQSNLSKKLSRDVNPIVYTPSEYSALYYDKKTLFESIENDKIKIL